MRKNPYLKSRKVNAYPLVEKIYIFCEGEKTEKNYFNGFKNCISKNPIYKRSVSIVATGFGRGTTDLVSKSKSYIIKNNISNSSIFIVFDKDDNTDESFDSATSQIVKLNNNQYNNNSYTSCWSNESFEFWILIHFEQTTTKCGRNDYIKKLNKLFESKFNQTYEKNDENLFKYLYLDGNPSKAINHSKKLLNIYNNLGKSPSKINPGSTVFILVEKLAKYLPEDVQKYFIDK